MGTVGPRGRVLLCWVLLQEPVLSLSFFQLLVLEKRDGFHSCLTSTSKAICSSQMLCLMTLSSLWKTAQVILHNGSYLGVGIPLPLGASLPNVWSQFWLSQLGKGSTGSEWYFSQCCCDTSYRAQHRPRTQGIILQKMVTSDAVSIFHRKHSSFSVILGFWYLESIDYLDGERRRKNMSL